LKPFDRERLLKVALRLRGLHPDMAAEVAERRIPTELVQKLVENITQGFHEKTGVVPRQFLRTFVNLLDVLVDYPERDPRTLLGFQPTELTPEEEAVLAGRELEVPPSDDGLGGAPVSFS
jgi:hypothetical protein